MNSEYRQEHIQDMLMWDLDRKIDHAKNRVVEFYEKLEGKVYIAYSGGKDSTALLHLVRSIYPDIVAVFSNTTNELPEILDHVRETDNVVWVNPKMTFNETIKKYGFPLLSKMTARKVSDIKHIKDSNTVTLYKTGYNSKGKYSPTMKLAKRWVFLTQEQFDITGKCCDILKKEPMGRYAKESGLSPIIGTQVGESDGRKVTWINQGCNVFGSKENKCRPLSIWTEKDIWDYIRINNIKYSTAYDNVVDDDGNVIAYGETRTGCAYCAFGAHLEKPDPNGDKRFDRLAKRKPYQFKKMMALENNGKSFEYALSKIGIDVSKYTDKETEFGGLFSQSY